jgi:hypothetical protein
MYLIPNELTGSRLIGAVTPLGEIGPKHHGVILGTSIPDNKTYVAEKRVNGYQITKSEDFAERYKGYGEIRVCPNNGPFSGVEVAKRALDEINAGGNGRYDLIKNNCESFVNRAMYGKSTSIQVINAILLTFLVFGGIWIIKETKGVG